jgi:hypothetical protein
MRESFDPYSWRDAQRKQIQEMWASGQVDIQTLREALDEVDCRFREMTEQPPPDSKSPPGGLKGKVTVTSW